MNVIRISSPQRLLACFPTLFSSNTARLMVVLSLAVSLAIIYSSSSSSSSSIFLKTPMCNIDGVCGESPSEPTPRTIYSARSESHYKLWWEAHAELNRSAAAFVAQHYSTLPGKAEHKKHLIFLGDSITESWLGTNMGEAVDRSDDIPIVLEKHFPESLVLAIGGDQVQHLEWRLRNGELPLQIQQDKQATFVVLIGTNNLGSGILPGPTVDGIVHLVEYLLEVSKGQILLLLLLPRGDSHRLPHICPPRCNSKGKPLKSFMPAIAKVNKGVIQQLGSRDRIKLADCGASFVGTPDVNILLMPDSLHPNAAGHEKLAECIERNLPQ